MKVAFLYKPCIFHIINFGLFTMREIRPLLVDLFYQTLQYLNVHYPLFEEMEDLGSRYWGSFMVCGFLCAVMLYIARSNPAKTNQTNAAQNSKFAAFQTNYLFVFMLAMFSDWLQGP